MSPNVSELADLKNRLDLSKPVLVSNEGLRNHELSAVQRGNAALARIFKETRTQLPKLIASVRWSVLSSPYKDFSEASGMSPNGYRPMEEDLGGNLAPHRSKYTRLLAYWEEQGVSLGVREQLLDLLTMPDLLKIAPDARGVVEIIDGVREASADTLNALHMNAFYHRIGFDRGHEKVEQNRPAFYNTIWQREKTQTIPTCQEVLSVVEQTYPSTGKNKSPLHHVRAEEGLAVWSATKEQQYLRCTIEEPLATMLVRMERDLAVHHGVTCTAQSLQEVYGFGPLHAQQLIQRELVDPSVIEPVVKKLADKKEFSAIMTNWQKEWEVESKRESFGTLATKAMDKRGFTTPELAKLVGIKTPEERGVQKKTKRKQRYRPDSEIRSVLYNNHVSRQVAVAALVSVLAENPAQEKKLREAYIAERERFFTRNGAGLKGKGFKLRVLRELANASLEEVVTELLSEKAKPDEARQGRKMVQHLEWMTKPETGKFTYKNVFAILEKKANREKKLAAERVAKIDEVAEGLKEFSTVQEMATNLIMAMKGAKIVNEAMRDIARNDDEWLRPDLISRMSEGKFMPPLPALRIMLKATLDQALPPSVERDWHEKFPEALTTKVPEFVQVNEPLTRVLSTLIAMKEGSIIRFYKDRVPGVVPTQGTKLMRDLEEGEQVDWRHVHKTLLGAGCMPATIPYQLAKGLYESGNDVQTVVESLLPTLKQRDLEIHPINLPGLTMKELKKYLPKAKPKK